MVFKGKRLFILTPIFVLFAAGVLFRSTSKLAPTVACGTSNFSGLPISESLASFSGTQVTVPTLAKANTNNRVLGVAKPSEKWIEVDISDQKLRAWDGESLFLETLISSGLSFTPTPHGEFRIWIKLRATKMEGGEGRNYYYLPNVPYVMFFENEDVPGWRGYGLHGTYWHDDFGTQRSHGCVNLPTSVAEQLYYWTTPVLPEGKSVVYSSESNPGTRLVIHE